MGGDDIVEKFHEFELMTNCLAKLFHYGFKVGGISFMTAIIKRIINFFFVCTHSSGITFNEDDLHATRGAPSSSV